MYKLICFDLDGTLLNSISDIALSMNKVLLNYNLPTYEVIEYKKFIGNGSKKLVQRAALDNYTDEMLEQYSNIYNNNATVTSEEYEDVTKTLLNLKTKYADVDAQYKLVKTERQSLKKQIKTVERRIKSIDNAKDKIRKNML